MYRHVMVCIDFRTPEAARLLAAGMRLKDGDGQLSAVSVIEVGTFDDSREAVAALIEEEYLSRSAHLQRLCADAGYPEADQRVVVGKAATEIAACAARSGCDLVVMGEHDRGDGRPRGLGSTADGVLRRIRCDALVIRTRPRRG